MTEWLHCPFPFLSFSWQFLRCSLYLKMLIVLRNTDQVFLPWYPSVGFLWFYFLMVRLVSWNFERKTIEIKCHFHHILSTCFFFFLFLIGWSGFIRESQDYRGLKSWHWGSSCQRWAQLWQSTGCTKYTSWPGPPSSFSLVCPLWEPDMLVAQHSPGNHGLYLQACGQLLPECSEPPSHTGPG